MEKLTILVDMDDTIEDLLGAWVTWLNRLYGLNVQKEEITDWDMTMAFPTLSPHEIFNPLEMDTFWKTVRPKSRAPDMLMRLIEDGHQVFIVTSSGYKTIRPKTEQVLLRYFPFLSWDRVIVTSHKDMVRGDVIVDDAPHNLEGDDDRLKILFDAPHNRTYDAYRHGMVRADTWEEVYEYIAEFADVL